jgi:hypothetical protein
MMNKYDEERMLPFEKQIVQSVTKKDCLKDCLHCEHTDAHDRKLPFRLHYCENCRLDIWHTKVPLELDDEIELIFGEDVAVAMVEDFRTHAK